VADSTRPVREPTERSYTVYVCPECRKQSHPHDGTCSKDVRPGQFRPAHMYEVVPLEVVPVSEVERLRLRVDELELHVPCAECIQEREDAEAEAERLRARNAQLEIRLRERDDETAADLASALAEFAGADCLCFGELECQWCRAANALRRYTDG
jgi:hypothetical protein